MFHLLFDPRFSAARSAWTRTSGGSCLLRCVTDIGAGDPELSLVPEPESLCLR